MLCEMRGDVIDPSRRGQHDVAGDLTEYDPLIFVKRPCFLDRDCITDPIFYRNPATLDRDPILMVV
jgi:hypothetical protein